MDLLIGIEYRVTVGVRLFLWYSYLVCITGFELGYMGG